MQHQSNFVYDEEKAKTCVRQPKRRMGQEGDEEGGQKSAIGHQKEQNQKERERTAVSSGLCQASYIIFNEMDCVSVD